MERVKIALTMGDPSGVGPELAVYAASDREIAEYADIKIYGSPDIINHAVAKFAPGSSDIKIVNCGDLKFNDIPIGQADKRCGVEAKNAVELATNDTIAGKMDAIVTTPMNKASVNLAGIPFTGHTEFIAELCGCESYAMMQSSGNLRIAFVTTHIPLAKVASSITEARIIEVTTLLNKVIKDEGIATPRIAVAAINPHAGENGYMGMEDEDIVKPALDKLRTSQINIEGPFPPDTLFIKECREEYDGILSMYHDQGHIPFKMLAFDKGVNSTLGLPIIRTSVDHGTAFNIAWKGVADRGSLYAAIKLASIRASR